MRLVALAVALLLVGSITLEHAGIDSTVTVSEVEARLDGLVAGSTGGTNGTSATASVAGALLAVTTDVLYLNNTNATGAWHARLEVVAVTGLANLALLDVGIDNGTRTPQVEASLGALTQTTGAPVRLAPGSANRIYVTASVATLGVASTVELRLVASDAGGESAYVVSTVTLSVT